MAVKFVSPYPVLVSSSQDGTVCIWGVKGSKLYRNVCLARFINIQMTENFHEDVSINTLLVH